MKRFYEQLFENNQKWALKKLKTDKNFFKRLADGQNPQLLWIGCADSRVPANEITGTQAGELFVHRNIANMVVHTDMNMLSVLDYAVNVLEVQHVIVCGHYGCGGAKAAMSNMNFGILDNWIRHLKDIHRFYRKELNDIEDRESRANRFVELNVLEQVQNLSKTPIIQSAWRTKRMPHIHGWVYDVGNGLVKDLGVSIYGDPDLEDSHDYAMI